jgi:hypothetical protein
MDFKQWDLIPGVGIILFLTRAILALGPTKPLILNQRRQKYDADRTPQLHTKEVHMIIYDSVPISDII